MQVSSNLYIQGKSLYPQSRVSLCSHGLSFCRMWRQWRFVFSNLLSIHKCGENVPSEIYLCKTSYVKTILCLRIIFLFCFCKTLVQRHPMISRSFKHRHHIRKSILFYRMDIYFLSSLHSAENSSSREGKC